MKQFVLLLVFLFLAFPVYAEVIENPGADFRTASGQDAWEWLEGRSFSFERAADDKSETNIYFSEEKGLVLEALDHAQAIFALRKGYLENYRDVEISWGVDKFPEGASYEKEGARHNEAVMLFVFFGEEKISSGSLFIPDLPYFIAIRLCQNDTINKPELGNYYHKGGRFVCVAHPEPGEVVQTRFDLKEAFREYFGFEAPPLQGVAFEFDTNGAPDGGRTKAFIQQIQFPAATYIRED